LLYVLIRGGFCFEELKLKLGEDNVKLNQYLPLVVITTRGKYFDEIYMYFRKNCLIMKNYVIIQ
jgi:hypothetical protein